MTSCGIKQFLPCLFVMVLFWRKYSIDSVNWDDFGLVHTLVWFVRVSCFNMPWEQCHCFPPCLFCWYFADQYSVRFRLEIVWVITRNTEIVRSQKKMKNIACKLTYNRHKGPKVTGAIVALDFSSGFGEKPISYDGVKNDGASISTTCQNCFWFAWLCRPNHHQQFWTIL